MKFIAYYLCIIKLFNQSKASFDGSGFCFVARFVEQSKHVLLVCLYARLVEWIDTQDIARDTARTLKEIEQLSDIVFVEFRQCDLHIWYTTINMRKHRA